MDKLDKTKPTKNKKKKTLEKGDCDMALLAKPSNTMILIDKDKTQSFLEDYKKNLIKPEFLEKCKKYYDMMHKDDKGEKE